jgi:hypothetical protein
MHGVRLDEIVYWNANAPKAGDGEGSPTNGGTALKTSILLALLVLTGSVFALADDHGNSPLAASPIETDSSLTTACIEEAGDMDYFLFRATAGRTYRFTTSHPTELMDALLYLIDSDGQGILAVDDDSAGGTNARIVWTCHETSIYFLMVRHAQATTGSGCYGLSATIVQLDDYGNDRLSASPLLEGEPVDGFLEEPGDVDAFLIQTDRGYEYAVRFSSSVSETDVMADVFANGASEPTVSLASQGSTQIETIAAPATGTLFVVVQSASGGHTGGYTLTITKGGYADDHGNSAVEATSVPVEWSEIQGRLEVSGDVDWFQLDAREQAEYTFALASTEGSSGLRLAVRGPDGQLLQESATEISGNSIEVSWQAPATGTYYLEISSTNGIAEYLLNVSSTLQLGTVGSFNPSGYSLDIEVAGAVAYLVVGTKGLLILDVSDPSDPFEVGSNSTNGYAQAVAVDGNTAFVANRSEGVTVIDVSDPSRPLQVATFDTPGSAHAITIHQGLALISDQRGGLQIARIQQDKHLIAVSAVETKGYPAAVAATDHLAVVAVGDAGLEIIDLTVPASPTSIGHLDLPGDATDVAVQGTLAYVATGYRGVRIVDLSDPTAPSEVGWLSTTGETIAVLISGNTLFVAERTAGMSAYSLMSPLEPQLVAQLDTPGEATAVTSANGYVYIADRQEGMLIVQLLP